MHLSTIYTLWLQNRTKDNITSCMLLYYCYESVTKAFWSKNVCTRRVPLPHSLTVLGLDSLLGVSCDEGTVNTESLPSFVEIYYNFLRERPNVCLCTKKHHYFSVAKAIVINRILSYNGNITINPKTNTVTEAYKLNATSNHMDIIDQQMVNQLTVSQSSVQSKIKQLACFVSFIFQFTYKFFEICDKPHSIFFDWLTHNIPSIPNKGVLQWDQDKYEINELCPLSKV